jgi:hypothetical protein
MAEEHQKTARADAFDAAVKRACNADYTGRATLEGRADRDRLIDIRDMFNGALAVEGQHVTGHAPHAPFYFDYLDSPRSNALAFADGEHSFVGVTLPCIRDIWIIAERLTLSDDVLSVIGVTLRPDRARIFDGMFWLILNFVVTHEYTHHVHGHLSGHFTTDAIDEIVGGSGAGNLRRQARELDADGYAAYFSLTFWLMDVGGRDIGVEYFDIGALSPEVQDRVLLSSFLVAFAGFTFLRQPAALDPVRVYWDTHPPQSLRLEMGTRHAEKWCREFRPLLTTWMNRDRYSALMRPVTAVMWSGAHAAGWDAQNAFMRTPEGVKYRDALFAELDAFRETLG